MPKIFSETKLSVYNSIVNHGLSQYLNENRKTFYMLTLFSKSNYFNILENKSSPCSSKSSKLETACTLYMLLFLFLFHSRHIRTLVETGLSIDCLDMLKTTEKYVRIISKNGAVSQNLSTSFSAGTKNE